MNLYLALGLAAVFSFVIAFALGYVVIPFLHKLSFGQTILDIGPKWHKDKQGTPIMGGIMFIVSTLVSFGAVALIDHFCGGKIIVVKYGGSAMSNEELQKNVIKDVTLLKLVGFKPDSAYKLPINPAIP